MSESICKSQNYRSRLVKWLLLANEKKTAVSQDWRHKTEKPSYQSFFYGKLSKEVGLELFEEILSEFELHYITLLGERSEPHTGVFNRDFA